VGFAKHGCSAELSPLWRLPSVRQEQKIALA